MDAASALFIFLIKNPDFLSPFGLEHTGGAAVGNSNLKKIAASKNTAQVSWFCICVRRHNLLDGLPGAPDVKITAAGQLADVWSRKISDEVAEAVTMQNLSFRHACFNRHGLRPV